MGENTISGRYGSFFNLAGIIVTSHSALTLLEASTLLISHNKVNFSRADPLANTPMSYYGSFDIEYSSYGISVTGVDIILSHSSAILIRK